MLASNLESSTRVFRVYSTVEDVEPCDIQRRYVSTCDKHAQGWTTIVEMDQEKNEIFSDVHRRIAPQSSLFRGEHIRGVGMIYSESDSEDLPSLGHSLDAMTSGREEDAYVERVHLLKDLQYRHFHNGEELKGIYHVLLQVHEEE